MQHDVHHDLTDNEDGDKSLSTHVRMRSTELETCRDNKIGSIHSQVTLGLSYAKLTKP